MIAPPSLENPIRAELFSIERLEQHAESLAAAQRVTSGRGRRLLPRVEDNGRALRAAYRVIATAIREERAITPAAEWLVDNFHVVDEQLREIRDDLPPGFYRELPKLSEGPLVGYPRVYGIAWAFVAHTDSRFDPEFLRRFLLAYQRVDPLTIGELWAVAITLRVVLVENLRRLAEGIVRGRAARQAADALADELLGIDADGATAAAARGLARLERDPLATAFAVQLVQRLRDQDPAVTPALLWLDQRLQAQDTTSDDIVRVEHQRQAAMNVTVRNVIMSMSLMSALDWARFFETVSLVDEVLQEDQTYAALDFTTRDGYRHAVEELARGSGWSELDVARETITHARRNAGHDDGRQDPGFYLIGNGRRALELAIGYRASGTRRLLRAYILAATPGYLGTILVLTGLLLALPLLAGAASGVGAIGLLLLTLLAVVPASDLAIALLNRSVTALVTPGVLPRLDLRDGVPPPLRTMVVVPMLLTDGAEVEAQLERLEVHYLANPDGDLRFAVLSDWMDAPADRVAGDDETLQSMREGIAGLNRRHGAAPAGDERFLLFHRRRLWNESERTWMGWERKRGKLHELNRLLRGATDTSFVSTGSRAPVGVRYVITLDSDTRLPRGAVERLVGTMAHPLNRPRLDPGKHRVVDGYAVLQPRVTSPLPGGEASFLQRLSSGTAGVDPYAAAVSDVYQDLWSEGSYTGKGIYDVDAFEAALAGRVPENAMLSHDLFEGVFARAGLVTDVELFESTPSHYGVAAARLHRWARGDWQLLPWILGRRIPVIGRWKMLDNLRRTLSAPAAFLTLVVAWITPGTAPAIWSAFILIAIATPSVLPVVSGLIPRRRGISKRSHARAIGRDVALAAAQIGLAITMLAYQAALMTDAIVRTLVRVYVTRRGLLEWTTAAQATAGLRLDLAGFVRRMAGGYALAGVAAVAVAAARPSAWAAALPFLLLWGASPAVARSISLLRRTASTPPLAPADARALRLIGRRTWRFFTTFVGAADHALPPDNFQETPSPVVAHRTSPTNIGLYLLSTVAARDFGWLGTLDTIERLEASTEAMNALERFRGHFYNWYETRELRPLEPKYVSSVDSGNLAGHLIALAHACEEMITRSLPDPAARSGIEDTALLVRLATFGAAARPRTATRARLDEALNEVSTALQEPLHDASEWTVWLAGLNARAHMVAELVRALVAEDPEGTHEDAIASAEALCATVASHTRDLDLPDTLVRRLTIVAERARAMVEAMDFGFLFDPMRKLFAIGYRVAEGSLDPGRYDLLASEARLASFVAIAKGDVPVSHWFRLGRALTPVERDSVLVSWSGSMFEYLMPGLVMRTPAGSLLEQTSRLVVRRQITYGAERGVPWGVSESGYNVRDLEMTYQYSNFGVPGLGRRRGLNEDVVIAPYATALAAMVDPAAAVQNFRRLSAVGASGRYGFYEALDYTGPRLPETAKVAVVRAYMAHHQGMVIVAIANAVHDGRMRARFHAEPMVRATELLLQERTPRDVAVARPPAEAVQAVGDVRQFIAPVARRFTSPHGATPRIQLLSNGRYAVMMTAAGSGYSRWRDLAITRWREDVTRDAWGTYVFVRDVESGESWSAGYQPRGGKPESYEVTFAEDRVEIARRDRDIGTMLQAIVSPEDDAEVRRVSLTNLGTKSRQIEVTSYAEIVLAPPAADIAHPAFSNLSVQTECVPELDTLFATRRPRSAGEAPVWLAHVVGVEGEIVGGLEWETDRARFLGRGRGIRSPVAVIDAGPLSNTTGAVLDPIVSLRRRVRLPPGDTVRVAFSTLVTSSRAEALGLAEKYRDPSTFDRAATLAWTQAQVQQHHLGISPDEAHLFQSLASRVLYSDRALRPPAGILAHGMAGPDALWAHGISGDLPIVLVQIDEPEDAGIVRQLLRAHEYWRMKQLAVDLVILNERAPSYVQDLQTSLETLVRTSQSTEPHEGHAPHGNAYIVRADRVTAPQREVLQSVARAVLSSGRGTLAEQMSRAQRPDATSGARSRRPPAAKATPAVAIAMPVLEFFNGVGGFDADGREYVIVLADGRWTPAPWINVIANPNFGFQVSEAGSGYTWSVNSRENQLTAWSNDPVSDPPGETIYVRDEETGDLWGPTALPIRDASPYVIRHGQGYTRFEHVAHGIALELLQCVPLDDSIKISRLTLVNESGRPRRLSVTAYVEWVLGASRSTAAPFVVTDIDEPTGAMFARNGWRREFGARVAFADLGGAQTSWTADRTEFLGRNGSPDQPAALAPRHRLSGRVGAGLDPCSALQATIELPAGGRADVVFFLGEAASTEQARELILRYRTREAAAVLRVVTERWGEILATVQVKTPDRSMDILLNRWLLYQTLACRVWARAAFYQASGAYGFRDQLQDVMALGVAAPSLARDHVLRAAARQFEEGDVQHWWHPPGGRGVRTRISDDLLWLPYVVARHVEVAGDGALLDELVPFLEGPKLAVGQLESYFEPRVSGERATLFEHCARALDHSLARGSHGLPLMGTGDWNDGMNEVGAGGKGESVWLGWFLHTLLSEWAKVADARGERERAKRWRASVAALKASLEDEGWDGHWYRRAYFDDGTPLGAAVNDACRIDSIAQSWSVISGAGDPKRQADAMAAVDEHLVRRGDDLVLLLTPPFDDTALEPGYIKGYVPGVRENGGQYTHAAIWSAIAFAALGDGDKAAELFAMLNPINHARTEAGVERYKVEPYVVAADVYAGSAHAGRGGWTWYTGSAGWMYRAGLEWILGFRVRGRRLVVDPCIPRAWRGFEIGFRYRSARYDLVVENPHGLSRGVSSVEVDGVALESDLGITLTDDGKTHRVRIRLG